MADHTKKGAMRFYIIIAVVLMVMTYLEFVIVEYTIPGLTPFLTILLLVVMSLVKFGLVVAIYMHLRDDDPLYTGFFSSGIVIAIGTFIALTFLFTVSSVMNPRAITTAVSGIGEDVGAGEDVVEPGPEVVMEAGELATEGHAAEGHSLEELIAERPLAENLRVPAPKLQRIDVPLPAAQLASFSLKSVGELGSGQEDSDEGSSEDSTSQQGEQETTGQDGEQEGSSSEADTEVLAQGGEFDWQALGESTYGASCVSCHQANGQGIPGAFPPLAAHMPTLYNVEGGREYIINVVLYGLQGEIEVDGSVYNGVMTPWAQLSDEEIAATLNHELTSWDNEALLEDFSPLTPDEVAALRDQGLSSSDVLELRPELP